LRIAKLNQYANQAAQPLISGGRIYPVKILFPPLDLQNKFSEIAKEVEAKKPKLQKSLGLLSDIFSALSQKAFNGRLAES
jgi:type I restriction enzyme S subunit